MFGGCLGDIGCVGACGGGGGDRQGVPLVGVPFSGGVPFRGAPFPEGGGVSGWVPVKRHPLETVWR